MKLKLLFGTILICFFLANNVRAQEFWIYAGIADDIEFQSEFGTTGGGLSFPVSASFIKRVNPKFSFAIAPVFYIVKNPMFLPEGDYWRNANLEIPVMARWHPNGWKRVALGLGVYAGFNLSSTLQEAGVETDVKYRNPYFGVPVWIDMTFNRFSFGLRNNVLITDPSPSEFPSNTTAFNDYFDFRTYRISLQLVVGFRLK